MLTGKFVYTIDKEVTKWTCPLGHTLATHPRIFRDEKGRRYYYCPECNGAHSIKLWDYDKATITEFIPMEVLN